MEQDSEKVANNGDASDMEDNSSKEVPESAAHETTNPDEIHSADGGKKDPSLRRQELLVNSGFAEVWFSGFTEC